MSLTCYHCGNEIDTHNGDIDHTVMTEDNEQKLLVTLCHTCFMVHFDYNAGEIVENTGINKNVTKQDLKNIIIDTIGEKNYKKLKIDKPIDKHFEELTCL